MASIAVQSRSKRKASHDADDAGQNTSDESDVGHNPTQARIQMQITKTLREGENG